MKPVMTFITGAFLLLLLAAAPALAQASPAEDEMGTAALEARAQNIGKALRCVVCQNQSIYDSRASLAGDMRAVVMERLEAGATDEEVMDYMVERYGNYVLMNPPLQMDTLFLWFGPALFILLAGLGWYLYARQPRRDTIEPEPLSEDEIRKLGSVLPREPGP